MTDSLRTGLHYRWSVRLEQTLGPCPQPGQHLSSFRPLLKTSLFAISELGGSTDGGLYKSICIDIDTDIDMMTLKFLLNSLWNSL